MKTHTRTSNQQRLQVLGFAMLLGAVLFGGCGTATDLSPHHGAAVRQTMAAQIVNPNPSDADRMVAGAEGTAVKEVNDAYVQSFAPDAEDKTPVVFSFGGIK